MQAQPNRSIWAESIDFDRFIIRFFQSMISAARTTADITYDHLSVHNGGRIITVTGLEVYPTLSTSEQCRISVERINVAVSPWDEIDNVSLRIEAMGASFDITCIPEIDRAAISRIRQDRVSLDQALATIDYHVPTAQAQIFLHSSFAELLEMSVEANFEYLAIEYYRGDPLPVALVESAIITVTNLGIWETIEPLLPRSLVEPAVVGAIISDQLTEFFQDGASEETETLGLDETALITSARDVASNFVANPSRIVLELRPDSDTYFDILAYDRPGPFIRDMKPVLRTTPSTEVSQIAPSLLLSAIKGDATVEELTAVGRALLTGQGLPQNVVAAQEILTPHLDELDLDTLTLLAEEMPDQAEAYAVTLSAAAGGASGAISLLARLEDELSLDVVLEAQERLVPLGALFPEGNAADLRRAAGVAP